MSYPHSPQVYPQDWPGKRLKNKGKKGAYQNISTALHKTVEISLIYITLYLGGSVEQNFGGKHQFVPCFVSAAGVYPEAVVLHKVPVQVKALSLPRFAVVAHGKFFHGMLPVEVAGEKIVDPVHVAGVVHMSVAVEVGKAYVPLAAVFHRSGNQTAGKRQFRSPKRTGNDDAALVGRNAASGILIHQNPEADRTGALIARLIVDDNGTGIADVGVGHGPCLNVDGFAQFRETVDLHPVPGHRPEQPVAFQRVRKLVAVPPRDLLREI